jgi:hypothetical protein
MSIDRILPYYVGGCTVSLFTGIAYETETLVLRPFDVMVGVALVVTAGAAARRGYARRLDKGLPYYLFAALYLYRGLSGLMMTGPVLAVKELIQGFEFPVLIHLVAQAVKRKSIAIPTDALRGVWSHCCWDSPAAHRGRAILRVQVPRRPWVHVRPAS